MDISVPGLRAKTRKGGSAVYYWEPWPEARALGFAPRALRRADGSPMDAGEAITAARAIVEDLRRAQQGEDGKPRRSRGRGHDFSDLIHRYRNSKAFKDLAAATRRVYACELNIIEAEFGDTDVRVFDLPSARRFLETFKKPSRRSSVGRVLRLLLSYGADPEVRMIGSNPMLAASTGTRVRLIPPTKVRVVECSYEMEAALAAAAEALGHHAIKLAIFAATCTGQRETDVVAFSEAQRNEQGLHVIVQSKMQKADSGPVTTYIPFYLPRLQAALDAEMKRRRQGKLASIEKRWFINPNTGAPYTTQTLARHFAEVRAHAAKTMPAVAGIQFRDLRDTFITRCNEAECEPVGIMAVSGHKPPVLPVTWRHYLKLKPRMAARCLEKLMAHEAELGVPAMMQDLA